MRRLTVLEVHRTRLHNLSMVAGMLALAALGGFHVWQKLQEGELSLPAVLLFAMFTAAAAFSLSRTNTRTTLIAIGPQGLDLPGVAPQPIAWQSVREIRAFRSIGGARLDVTVEPLTFATLTLGNRWMGDHAVKGRHLQNGFTILLRGMDRSVSEVEAAIRHHWSPYLRTSEEE